MFHFVLYAFFILLFFFPGVSKPIPLYAERGLCITDATPYTREEGEKNFCEKLHKVQKINHFKYY